MKLDCEKLCERVIELEERVHKLEHSTTKKGETEVISDKLDKLLEQNIDLSKDLRLLSSRYINNSLMLESLVEQQKNTIAYKNFLSTPLGKGILITLVFIFLRIEVVELTVDKLKEIKENPAILDKWMEELANGRKMELVSDIKEDEVAVRRGCQWWQIWWCK